MDRQRAGRGSELSPPAAATSAMRKAACDFLLEDSRQHFPFVISPHYCPNVSGTGSIVCQRWLAGFRNPIMKELLESEFFRRARRSIFVEFCRGCLRDSIAF